MAMLCDVNHRPVCKYTPTSIATGDVTVSRYMISNCKALPVDKVTCIFCKTFNLAAQVFFIFLFQF